MNIGLIEIHLIWVLNSIYLNMVQVINLLELDICEVFLVDSFIWSELMASQNDSAFSIEQFTIQVQFNRKSP